jgi:transposase
MAAAIATGLRERVVRAYERGEGTQEEIAKRFAVGRRSVQRWVALKEETGSVERRPLTGGNFSDIDRSMLRELVTERPEATTHELTAEYNRRVGPKRRTHRSSVLRALHRSNYVFKKSDHGRRNKIVPM